MTSCKPITKIPEDASFDLITEPWIPVLYGAGHPSGATRVGLAKLFEDAAEIRDLALPPLQRIAVMRLLICITQAALDGPENDDDWLSCRERIQPAVRDYLQKWHDRFNLFGQYPFLQVANLQPVSGKSEEDLPSLDKLNFAWAAGNAHTLFDHTALSGNRQITLADLPIYLLTFQCFHPGGLLANALWDGEEISRSTTQAPCVEGSALLGLILGKHLLESIYLNLLPKQRFQASEGQTSTRFGRPIWEFSQPPKPSTRVAEEFVRSYLGRLVPFSRAIRLIPGTDRCLITKGLDYPRFPQSREPFATVVARERRKDLTYLRLSVDRHPWRELHSVLVLGGIEEAGGPLSLHNIRLLYRHKPDLTIDLWVGGMEVDQAKLIDSREWLFSFTPRLLETNNLAVYQQGVSLALNCESSLRSAVQHYCKVMQLETRGYTARAVGMYWSMLDNFYPELIRVAEEAGRLDSWEKRLLHCALEAYHYACPAETPRQMHAFVMGRRTLFRSSRRGVIA
jgi:CRISPR system Cascade subunit CasA